MEQQVLIIAETDVRISIPMHPECKRWAQLPTAPSTSQGTAGSPSTPPVLPTSDVSLYVLGASPSLGGWDHVRAVEMKLVKVDEVTPTGSTITWTCLVKMPMDSITTIRFLIKDRIGRPVSWEVMKRIFVPPSMAAADVGSDPLSRTMSVSRNAPGSAAAFDVQAGRLQCGENVTWDSGWIPRGQYRLLVTWTGPSPVRLITPRQQLDTALGQTADPPHSPPRPADADLSGPGSGTEDESDGTKTPVLGHAWPQDPSLQPWLLSDSTVAPLDHTFRLKAIAREQEDLQEQLLSALVPRYLGSFSPTGGAPRAAMLASEDFRPVLSFHYKREEYHQFVLDGTDLLGLGFYIDVYDKTNVRIARAVVPGQLVAHIGRPGCLSGVMIQPVLTNELSCIGFFRAHVLVVKGHNHPNDNLSKVFRTYWRTRPSLYVGHRGDGSSDKLAMRPSRVMENTLLSLEKAALSGADFVEFDVQLDADMDPVISHEWALPIHVPGADGENVVVEVPVARLRYSQLSSLYPRAGVAHSDMYSDVIETMRNIRESSADVVRSMSLGALDTVMRGMQRKEDEVKEEAEERERREKERKRKRADDAEEDEESAEEAMGGSGAASGTTEKPSLPEHIILEPMPRLVDLFRTLPPFVGFNIELKHPMPDQAAAFGLMNLPPTQVVVDRVLDCVFSHAGDRRVVFSSFHPDACLLLSLKQARYPVFFLTAGGTKQFADPRCQSVKAAIEFAVKSHLQGIVCHAQPILERPEYVAEIKNFGLCLFTYGPPNQIPQNFNKQIELGVDAIISDQISRILKANGKTCSFASRIEPGKAVPSQLIEKDLFVAGEFAL